MLSIIVAISKNRVIGKNNKLPWSIKEDLEYFKTVTGTSKIIMGRKTYESIGRPLPNRHNIIITQNNEYLKGHSYDNLEICTNYHEIINKYLSSEEEVFIIGGGEIFKLFMPYISVFYINIVKKTYDGDSYFPLIFSNSPKNANFKLKLIKLESRKDFFIYIFKKEMRS